MINEGCLCDSHKKVLGVCLSPAISEDCLCEPRENVLGNFVSPVWPSIRLNDLYVRRL